MRRYRTLYDKDNVFVVTWRIRRTYWGVLRQENSFALESRLFATGHGLVTAIATFPCDPGNYRLCYRLLQICQTRSLRSCWHTRQYPETYKRKASGSVFLVWMCTFTNYEVADSPRLSCATSTAVPSPIPSETSSLTDGDSKKNMYVLYVSTHLTLSQSTRYSDAKTPARSKP